MKEKRKVKIPLEMIRTMILTKKGKIKFTLNGKKYEMRIEG